MNHVFCMYGMLKHLHTQQQQQGKDEGLGTKGFGTTARHNRLLWQSIGMASGTVKAARLD